MHAMGIGRYVTAMSVSYGGVSQVFQGFWEAAHRSHGTSITANSAGESVGRAQ